jgi:hypothetical protein
MIDLRSDTVEAMASAEVGDDVYGEDPSGHKLQSLLHHRTLFPGPWLPPLR